MTKISKKKITASLIYLICIGIFCNTNIAYCSNKNTSNQKSCSIFEDVKHIDNGVLKNLTDADIPPDIRRILKRGRIIVGLPKDDMTPFFMVNKKGRLYGLDIEMIRNIAKSLGVSIEYNRQAKDYQELFEMIAKGKVDIVLAKFSITIDRAKVIRYTTPYMKIRFAILVNKLYATKHNLENYPMNYLKKAKIKIGIKAKTSYLEYSKEIFKNAKIVQYSDWNNAVKDLKRGKIEAAMYDENEAIKLIRKDPGSAIYVSMFILKDRCTDLSIAVNWKDTQLLSWLNIYLDTNWKIKSIKDIIKEYPEVYK